MRKLNNFEPNFEPNFEKFPAGGCRFSDSLNRFFGRQLGTTLSSQKHEVGICIRAGQIFVTSPN